MSSAPSTSGSARSTSRRAGFRKGTNGVSTNGVTGNFVFVDRGTFRVLPLTYFYLPKSARPYLFPQSLKIHYFCSGPSSVDPICPQPKVWRPRRLAEGLVHLDQQEGRPEAVRAGFREIKQRSDKYTYTYNTYTYIYIYIYIIICTHTHICTCIYIYIYIYISIYLSLSLYIYIYIYIYVCMYERERQGSFFRGHSLPNMSF